MKLRWCDCICLSASAYTLPISYNIKNKMNRTILIISCNAKTCCEALGAAIHLDVTLIFRDHLNNVSSTLLAKQPLPAGQCTIRTAKTGRKVRFVDLASKLYPFWMRICMKARESPVHRHHVHSTEHKVFHRLSEPASMPPKLRCQIHFTLRGHIQPTLISSGLGLSTHLMPVIS